MDIRLLGNFKEVINRQCKGKKFSVIDLKDVFLQLPVDEKSRPYLVITTHVSFFRYTRLPFGVSSAPLIFQRIIDEILLGIDFVACFLDEIIITGESIQEHLKHIEEKCNFQDIVNYLGHTFDKHGVQPSSENIKAIEQYQRPTNTTEIKYFLGAISYYSTFIFVSREMYTII
ncbi:Retrovirus-related Pol polyprotein [Thelohanellus kitauei]|uniref:Retrovirus-related Pol polyprotein n=1 Tax=Thelohanellus kitauei TaxID=669202 RepID=A0A0C2N6A2_THEKT|nr:Retrovirus-related Pol polyprotein [Thelohanellus kitauei]